MSEIEGNWVNGWNPLLMENGLGIASRINDDLRELEPNAWVLWQPVEDTYNMDQPAANGGENLNWGSIFIDLDCQPYTIAGEEVWKSPRRVALAGSAAAAPECSVEVNSKYNTLRNYTHFITPGDKLIPTTSTSTTAAVAADGQSTTLVHSNPATTEQTVVVDLSKFGTIDADATLTAHVTTQAPSLAEPTANALVEKAPVAVDLEARTATYTVPAKSVTSFVIDGVSGVSDSAVAFEDGGTYQLVGQQSGRALSAETAGLTIRTIATTDTAAAQRQSWTVHEIDASGNDQSATKSYVLEDDAGRFLAATSAGPKYLTGTLAEAKANREAAWILNTTNGSTWSLVSASTALSLDVAGQASADGTSVGVYGSNGGANQTWSIRDITALPASVTVRTDTGVAPVLPTTVASTYSWGTSGSVPVTWESFDDALWAQPGTFEVTGSATNVFGATFEATATVEVGPLSATDPTSITVASGTSAATAIAQLPATVKARAGASALTVDAAVTWDTSSLTDLQLAAIGSVQLSGTATVGGVTLPALVTILMTEPSGSNIAPATTTTASASSTESGYPIDRTRNSNRTDKGWSNWVSSNKPTQSTLTYTFPESSINGTDVYYYRDGTNSWAQTMRVEYRTPGGVWTRAPGYETDLTVTTPPAGAPIVQKTWAPVQATGVRVVMNAFANTHLVVSEVEIFKVAPSASSNADLLQLRSGGQNVALSSGTTDYTATSTGSAFPVVQAFPVDSAATVRVTQPSAANGGVARIVVTPASGAAKTYTLTIERTATVGVTFDGEAVEGELLTAVVTSDPADAALTYVWDVDGTVVAGATGATYTPEVAGSEVSVTVTATAPGFETASASTTAIVSEGVAPISFVDVPPGVAFYDEISWLAAQGISTGWDLGNGTREYRPVSPVNRDAMAAFLYRLAGSPAYTAPATSPFTDVPTTNQFYKEISWLAAEGISTGWDLGGGQREFRPLTPVNRDAMAAFLYRFADVTGYTPPATSAFTDVPTSNLFYKEISWLAEKEISTGWPQADGSKQYRPLTSVNRDAMAAFMYRLDHLS